MVVTLLPRPFCINCVGGENRPGIHCFDDVTLWYEFPQNILEALYILRLLGGGSLKALHSLLSHPRTNYPGQPGYKAMTVHDVM